jgi:hypothetical protein
MSAPPDSTRRLATASATSYLLGCALGTSVASGLIDTHRIRWVHHALFGVTAALTAAAAAAGLRQRRPASAGLIAAGFGLARIARIGAGDRRHHTLTALAPAPCYAASLVMAWWDDGAARGDTT